MSDVFSKGDIVLVYDGYDDRLYHALDGKLEEYLEDVKTDLEDHRLQYDYYEQQEDEEELERWERGETDLESEWLRTEESLQYHRKTIVCKAIVLDEPDEQMQSYKLWVLESGTEVVFGHIPEPQEHISAYPLSMKRIEDVKEKEEDV